MQTAPQTPFEEKLGAIVSEYQRNFYGTDYAVSPESGKQIGLQSDRLFAEWPLESEKVKTLAAGAQWDETRTPEAEIEKLLRAPGLRNGVTGLYVADASDYYELD